MADATSKKGKLYLIPSTLGEIPPLEVLPISIKRAIEEINIYIVENEKTARHFIKKLSPRKSQPSLTLFALNKFTEASEIPSFLNPCLEGNDVGILSEAGCPGIADPGAAVVRIAHERQIQVVPLVGPSSIILALMASGMNGQNFAFNGYLAIDGAERKKQIKKLERKSKEENQSQIFIETPYRNNKLLEELVRTVSGTTRICVACDITLNTEFIRTKTASDWKVEQVDLHKRPAIFIIQA
ncbi:MULTISPECIES: SAM-dependent methyltransferase [Maribacter]|uniref:SAM-dependent methyltransferase n=1 Tax=Maribacter flavus TaxID=1658664 RepID=A0A5B2TQR2_9FLAO|nr:MULTISPECIES: SAM-dependent methyltransferase [Maribacter]KAA2216872.1 SAM-dependent methyltransferase [Maribacter flavus]MDC6405989.1 SAM-dependent methyltransferase [Maribacter sp. PR66]MEE1973226.1 SAM-dependent methyltransferase [Maribacter flavus]